MGPCKYLGNSLFETPFLGIFLDSFQYVNEFWLLKIRLLVQRYSMLLCPSPFFFFFFFLPCIMIRAIPYHYGFECSVYYAKVYYLFSKRGLATALRCLLTITDKYPYLRFSLIALHLHLAWAGETSAIS